MVGCRHKKEIPTEALDGGSSEKDCTCEKVVMVAEAGDGGQWVVCVQLLIKKWLRNVSTVHLFIL